MNLFEKFVIKHNSWREERHINRNKVYSDYDIAAGSIVLLSILVFIFLGLSTSLTVLSLALFLFILNKIEFVRKEPKDK